MFAHLCSGVCSSHLTKLPPLLCLRNIFLIFKHMNIGSLDGCLAPICLYTLLKYSLSSMMKCTLPASLMMECTTQCGAQFTSTNPLEVQYELISLRDYGVVNSNCRSCFMRVVVYSVFPSRTRYSIQRLLNGTDTTHQTFLEISN